MWSHVSQESFSFEVHVVVRYVIPCQSGIVFFWGTCIRTIIYTLSYQQSNNQSVIQSINQHFIFLLWLMSLTYDYKPNTTDIGSHTNQLHVKRKGSLTDMGSHTWQLHVPQKKTIPDWHGITYLTTTCTSKENDSWLTWDHIPDNYKSLKRKWFYVIPCQSGIVFFWGTCSCQVCDPMSVRNPFLLRYM
jgi:hypothetical protein